MVKERIHSVEPNVIDIVNKWLKSYSIDYKLEQESLNFQIDQALKKYPSKSGGKGGNRVDIKILKQDKNLRYYPILIECKGYENSLEKLDSNGIVANKNSKGELIYKNINDYAVNGSVHYANAILHYTSYTDIISIGITGFKDENTKELKLKIAVYYVSPKNNGMGKKVGEYQDLSFLSSEHFDKFCETIETLDLSEDEKNKRKELLDNQIMFSLVRLNQHIFKNEKGISEKDRVYLVAASIMATIGVKGKVEPLKESDLKSSSEYNDTDGHIIMKKIESFLHYRDIPIQKKDTILRYLSSTLLSSNINKVKEGEGETQLKRVFCKVIDDLGLYYKVGLSTDFTGALFNEMYRWLGYSQDSERDIVLTPSYVAMLLVKLARVDMNSYVWDFATGSAGLLVAAMNEMLADAKKNISSPQELKQKELYIKANQLLGLELIEEIYMLAILNMVLMGDGSSNIINDDSLKEFTGEYSFLEENKNNKFPATAFILNPPYSAYGNGMIFVQKALSMMNKGYASIIIQSSAGSGKAKEFNIQILKTSTLIANIKMPIDLFVGKSSVQTHIYVFKVGEAHHKDDIVKFIDFSDDGYTRSNRKKASVNLRDTSNAKEKYEEIVNLVRFGKSKLNFLKEQNYYENTIDPNNGADWNQSYPVDTTPTLEDFKKTVSDYLAWEVANILKNSAKEANPKLEK